jgi:hypothetical protein
VSLTFRYSNFSIFLKFRSPFEALAENHFSILVLFFFQLSAVTKPTQYPAAAYYITLPLSSPVNTSTFCPLETQLLSFSFPFDTLKRKLPIYDELVTSIKKVKHTYTQVIKACNKSTLMQLTIIHKIQCTI